MRPLSSAARVFQQDKQPKKKPLKKSRKDVEYGKLSQAQKAFLDRIIRVDQAGELGANYIYYGQFTVLASKYPHLRPVLQHMWDQEIHHHNTFNRLQTERRVRPSLLTPLWKVQVLLVLVLVLRLISKEAAMACTVAVETVIGGHYNQQLRVLMNQYNIPAYDKATGEILPEESLDKSAQCSPELTDLKDLISTFEG